MKRRRVRACDNWKERGGKESSKTVIITSGRSRDRCLVSTRSAAYNNGGRGEGKEEGSLLSRGREVAGCATVAISPTTLPRFIISISRNSMITKDRESVRRRLRLYFQLDPRWWIVGRTLSLSLLIDGMPAGEEVGGWGRGGIGPHGNYF